MNVYKAVHSTDVMPREDAARAWAVMHGNGVVSWHHTRADAFFWAAKYEAADREAAAFQCAEIDCDF